MPDKNKTVDELNQAMTNALFQLQELITLSTEQDYLTVVKTFLLGVVSTAIDLVEITLPGSAPLIYAEVEAAAKLGGLNAIAKWSSNYGSAPYSVSTIAEDDMTTAAMNYLGQQLSIALFKGLHELPTSLRNEEALLRSVEALLANLLNQKFKNNAYHILDSFYEHVQMALTDLTSRATH